MLWFAYSYPWIQCSWHWRGKDAFATVQSNLQWHYVTIRRWRWERLPQTSFLYEARHGTDLRWDGNWHHQTAFWLTVRCLKTPKSEAVIGLVRPNMDSWGRKNLSCIRGLMDPTEHWPQLLTTLQGSMEDLSFFCLSILFFVNWIPLHFFHILLNNTILCLLILYFC